MTSWEILHALEQNILTCCEAVRAGSSVFLHSQKGIASPDSHVGTGPLFKRRGLVSTHSGKKTCIRCLGFQSFTLKLTSPWSCANHDKLCCYCESLIFDQYVTNGHLTESFFIFFQFFCLLKIRLLCKSLPFFFFFQRLQWWWVIVSLFTSAGISRQFSTWFHIQSVLMFSLNPNC